MLPKPLSYYRSIFFSAMIVVPLSPAHWKQIPYGNTPVHVLTSDQGLKLQINKSAGALIYKFDKPVKLRSIDVSFTQNGTIDYQKRKVGEKGADDFPFRLGLVFAGEKKLSWSQSLIAPRWVKELYEIADSGLDRVYYLVVAQSPPKFKKRFHPLSELFEEEIVGVIENGSYQAKLIPPDGKVLGLWISSDADDTQSSFSVTIQRLNLEIQN